MKRALANFSRRAPGKLRRTVARFERTVAQPRHTVGTPNRMVACFARVVGSCLHAFRPSDRTVEPFDCAARPCGAQSDLSTARLKPATTWLSRPTVRSNPSTLTAQGGATPLDGST
jgi:hypothetical protein